MDAELSDPPAPAAPAPGNVYSERRERLLNMLGGRVALLPAAPELFRSRDTGVRYRPDADLFYLTGFPEPDALALLTPHDPEHRFTLFVRPRDPEREAWSGRRAGVEGARERYGADAAYSVAELGDRLPDLVRPASGICYPVGRDPKLDERVLQLLAHARAARPRRGGGPTGLEDLEPLTGALRVVKGAGEVDRIRTAARIAARAHRAAMAHARPGVGEWELEAAVDGTMRRLGASGPAFPTIVGSGANATVLHYVENDRRVRPGELVLVDAGADWGMYCSDISRTFPVSGRFSDPQRALYEVVLAAEEAAIAAASPGAPATGIHDAAVRELVGGMIALGLLTGNVEELVETGAHRRFYLHQTSHWLGLDVHDIGAYRDGDGPVALRPGMVLTVEPGLYIPTDAEDVPAAFRGLGIRIEDDVLITEAGPEILTRDVPVAPDEVEALVGSAG